jgi:mycobactin peptide synthetase MbtE
MIFQKELVKSLKANADRLAIEADDKRLSYSDVLSTANKVTAILLREGVTPETPVGVMMSDRADVICCLIGILNSRCVFVPVDGALPDRRLSAMMEDAGIRHLITDWDAAAVMEKISTGQSLTILQMEDMLKQAQDTIQSAVSYPDHQADDSIYIYFTSGSTGTPKGVVGRNESLWQFIQWEVTHFGISGDIRVSQLISPYFDAFLRDVFVPLFAGGTICLPPAGDDLYAAGNLISWIDRSGINLIHCVPSVFRLINNGSLKASHFIQLRYVLLSGEKIIPSFLADWYSVFGSRIQLVNLYGATETTMIRTFYPISPEDVNGSRIPIGSAISDTQLLVLDNELRSCEPLVAGEIYIVSDYMTKGYLNNPALTDQRFVMIDTSEGKKRAFKTGDRGRILSDGQIDLVGRDDRQVKLRGIRVELDEIEHILARQAAVESAVAVVRTESNGDRSLVAYIIRTGGAEGDREWEESLRHHLEEWLPAYMIPAAIIAVSAFPLLSNGKIDHKTLAEMSGPVEIIAPENEVEEKLLSIWKEILGDKAISTGDGFHKIGGNSLSIMKLIGRIYKEFKVRMSLSDLFNHLTVRKQASFIRRANKDNLYVIHKTAFQPTYHVSAAQERMYYSQQLNKEYIAYNLPMAWEIKGDADRSRVVEAFRALITRHEALRTAFRFEEGELRQFIQEQIDFSIEEIAAAGDVESAILDFVRPFDLHKAPLVRCGIIYSREGRQILVADFHHIICDGISQVNLLSELAISYNGGEPPAPPVQYKDYAEWEYNFRSSEEYLSHREFWLRNFEGAIPVLQLPTTHNVPGRSSEKGGSLTMEIPKIDLSSLLDNWNKEEITIFSGLFSLYFLFLSQLTGQEDIVVGIAASGRIQQELENVAGMFVKTLPIRHRLHTNRSFNALAKDINSYLIQANSKQMYDLSNIVMDLNQGRDIPVRSLFDVMFIYQNFEKVAGAGAIEFSRYSFDSGGAKYPISLFAFDDEHSFGFKWEYSTDCFNKSDMELLSAQFKSLVSNVAAEPEARIADIIGVGEQTGDLIGDDISFNF